MGLGRVVRLAVPLLLAAAGPACYSRHQVRPEALPKLAQAPFDDDETLAVSSGVWPAARFEPTASIRFRLADGAWTPWYEAQALRVTSRSFLADRELPFAQVQGAETATFSGSATLGATLGTAALLVVLVGGGGGSTGGGRGGSNDTFGDAPKVTPLSSLNAAPAEGARPLFSDRERRRATVRWLAAVEASVAAPAAPFATTTALAGARLWDLLEAGVAVTLLLPPAPTLPYFGARLGLSYELDPWRRVNLPLGADAGLAPTGDLRVRLRWGLRVRFAGVWVGLHPFNGVFHAVPPAGAYQWTWPTTVEVGVAL